MTPSGVMEGEDESARFALLLKLATLASKVFFFGGLVGEHEDE